MSDSGFAVDLAALKAKQQGAWSSGNYAVIGTTLQIVGEQLCEAVDLHAGETVLDVAAGNGNATLAAARRWGRVTSTDYVPALLDLGRARANAEGLSVVFREADAEALPFENGAFDVVLSTFGVMFTPDQETAAREMSRVCRAGGRIGLANWTPDGFVGQLFKTIGKFIPPPAGVKPPSLWGTEARLTELFPHASIRTAEREFAFRYLSASHWLEVFRSWYGPMHKAFAALDAGGQQALEADMIALAERFNKASDGTLVARGAYLEIVIER
ncbi:class I SAM-dependent methyltransferase [Cereibacter sp. SYSU M97828]|nr:class I SAM-dependent methyltransferase [Cereibacter flavus]